MRIDLACTGCGNNRFTLEGAKSDGCVVFCEDCGHTVGTLGELKERIAVAVLRRSSGDAAAIA